MIESASKPITSGYMRLSWAPDGRMLYTSMASGSEQIWRARADGTSPQQLTREGVNTDPVATPDGRAIVFVSIRGDVRHLWTMDADGRNARQLTDGSGETKPQVTPDGQFVVYNATTDFSMWRVPLAGGTPVRLTDSYAREPAVSPDGSLIAYNLRDRQAAQQWKIVVIPAGGGPPRKIFDRQRGDYQIMELNWTPEGRSITYEVSHRGVSNIWGQPLDGGTAAQLTHFTADYIYGFAWSRLDNQLAVVRGDWDSDVLLLSLRR
jgi:Tol biopolymer transport system component